MILTYIELGLDIIMGCIAIALIVKAQDNQMLRIWGGILLILSLVMVWENIHGLNVEPHIMRDKLTLLPISTIAKWYIFAHTLSLFTIGSQYHSWITTKKIVALSLFPIISLAVTGTYVLFNGATTHLGGTESIFENLSNIDVRIRFGLYCISIITPLIAMLLPLIYRKDDEPRITRRMYIFIGGFLLMSTAYSLSVLTANNIILNFYGFFITIVLSILSIMYLRHENHFAQHNTKIENTKIEQDPDLETISVATYKLNQRINAHMNRKTPFVNPNYSLTDLAAEIKRNKSTIIQAIKAGGFIGFREYINFVRLEHFKHLASTIPGTTVKELMFRCGFTSRSSFYRLFAEHQAMSPKEYIELHGCQSSNSQKNGGETENTKAS